MSETWLKNNDLLIKHVTIPGYDMLYKNREKVRGRRVGFYISNNLRYERQKHLESRFDELEHLWVKLPGRNKNCSLLLGVIYRSPTFTNPSSWLPKFEELLSYVKSTWDGKLMITGDFNLDLLCTFKSEVLQYCDILEQFNLTQIVNKPTRTTLNRASLIDHIILSNPTICKHTDVLPCPHISDHDGPYAILNVRVPRFQPRLKYIRDEKHLNIEQYVSDISDLPFSLIYAFDDVETKLDIFNSLILDCINKHAPLKKINKTK